MTGTAPQRSLIGPALRRFGALALLVAVVVALLTVAVIRLTSSTTYTAQGSFNVPISPQAVTGTVVLPGTPARPDDPQDAERYARAYAVLLNEDEQLLAALAGPTGMDPRDLATSITAASVPDSSVITVTFTAPRASQVRAYFQTMADIVAAPEATTPNLPPRNLEVLNAPTRITEQTGLAPTAPWIGVVLGLLVGLGTAVLLERLLPQVRSAADLREVAAWPVLELSGPGSSAQAESAVLRVLGRERGARTAVVPVRAAVGAAPRVAQVLAEAQQSLHRSGRLSGADATAFDAIGAVPGDGAAERAVQDSAAVVVVVPRRSPLSGASAALQRLEDLGAERVLLLITERGGWEERRGHRRSAAVAAPTPSSGGGEVPSSPVVARTR